MESKIIFLGTAGDAIVTGKQIRASGGIILQCGENQFHIDPGPASLRIAKEAGVNIRNNTALFVSHNHLNHSNDANAVISAMTHGGLDQRGVLICSQSVYEDTETTKASVSPFHRKCVEKSIIMTPGNKVGINDIEIHAVKANHSDPYAIGFKFFTKKFTLGYTSDTSYSDELVTGFKETDIMIINVKNPQGQTSEGHLNSEDAAKLISKVNPKLAIITHFGVKMLQADPMNEARFIQRTTKIQTISAKDGMVTNPISYSAGLNTKLL